MKFTLTTADILKKLEASGKLKEIQKAIKEKDKTKGQNLTHNQGVASLEG